MLDDFDLITELKKHKWPLLGMSLFVFVFTLLIFGGGSKAPRKSEQLAQVEESEIREGFIFDSSEKLFEADEFTRPEPFNFFARWAGSNQHAHQRRDYHLDEELLEARFFPEQFSFDGGKK